MRRQTSSLLLATSLLFAGCGGMPKIGVDLGSGGQSNYLTATGGSAYHVGDGGLGGSSFGGCSGTGCSTATECGNSIVESGESCDDGNSIPGDGCS